VEECIAQHELQQALLPSGKGLNAPSDAEPQEVRLQVDGSNGPLSLLARAGDVVLPAPAAADGRPVGAPEPVTGRVLVLTDITDLARMIQIKADFAANTSHELRTPLSAIRGAVETLLEIDLADEPESARKFLGVIERHSSRMQAMIMDLLNLSRLESSQNRFEPATLQPAEFLAELRAHYDDILLAKSLHWNSRIEEGLDAIVANQYLLRLTLENLVDNAIKFTDAGGRISVSVSRDRMRAGTPPSVSIEMADTGCGIPEEEKSRVFERFYQVERARSGGLRGTGLGLSIVRHAVAAMNGTLALQSKVGEGTSVTISLPQPEPQAA
jgi:two-component system phosphate regulon sensor histidine kinase PhoR